MTNEKCKIQTAIESVRKQALSDCRIALDNAASALGELGIVSTFSMVANHEGARLKILIDHIVNGSVEIEPCSEGIAPNARALRAKLFDALLDYPIGMLAALATDQAVPFNEKKVERFLNSDTPKKEKKFARKLVSKLLDQVPAVKLQAWLEYNGEEVESFEDDDEPNVEDDLFEELMEFPLFYLNLFAEETSEAMNIPVLAKLVKASDAIGDEDYERLQEHKQKLARCLAAELPIPVLDVWITENDHLKEGGDFVNADDENHSAPKAQTPADVLVSNLKATQLNTLCAHFNVVPKTKRVALGAPAPTKKEMADAILAKHKPKKVEAALVQLSLPQFKL
jgi:hypothetical protein